MPTVIHQFIREAEAGSNPRVIGKLPSGWLMFSGDQTLRGYCLLIANPIVPDINSLSFEKRAEFLLDMTRVGDALNEILEPRRINYSMLGNQDHALHAHIHPRFETETADFVLKPPFAYPLLGEAPVPFDSVRDAPLMAAIAKNLGIR